MGRRGVGAAAVFGGGWEVRLVSVGVEVADFVAGGVGGVAVFRTGGGEEVAVGLGDSVDEAVVVAGDDGGEDDLHGDGPGRPLADVVGRFGVGGEVPELQLGGDELDDEEGGAEEDGGGGEDVVEGGEGAGGVVLGF